MKKLILVFVILFLCLTSFSQILVGPVVGSQVSWIKFDNSDNKNLYSVKPVYGFHVGGSIAFRVQKRFFLQTSILYSQKGKVIEGKLDRALKNEATYQYIDIPMLYTAEFKAKIGRDKVYKVYIGAGPNISYWLGGKGVLQNSDLNENLINPPNYDLPYTVTFGKDPSTVEQGEMNVEEANRFQLGLQISSGIIFEPWGKQKIMITGRYVLGHSFLSANSKGNFGLDGVLFYEDDLRSRTKEIALTLHYFIDLKVDERKKGKTTSKIKSSQKKK